MPQPASPQLRDEQGNLIYPNRFVAFDWFKSKTFHLGLAAALGTLAQYAAHQITWQQAVVQAALGFVPAALRDTLVRQFDKAAVLTTVVHNSSLAHRENIARAQLEAQGLGPQPQPVSPPVSRPSSEAEEFKNKLRALLAESAAEDEDGEADR